MAEIENLIDGYQRFYQKYFTSGDTLYQGLAKAGQSPKTLIIACSDARVDPSIITNAEPGDIFVVRNVANLVPTYEVGDHGQHGVSAALEFAVCVLQVKHIVVLGHTHCAGIQTLVSANGIQDTDFIGKWMDIAKSAKEKAIQQCQPNDSEHNIQHICEKEAIQLSLHNLLTFPWIRKKVEEGWLTLHGWYFSLSDGSLQQFNPNNASFERI